MGSMKMVEIKTIQQQLQQQQGRQSISDHIKRDEKILKKNDSNVHKFKEMFDSEKLPESSIIERSQENRRSKKVKSDIFTKIQALEKAEKERLEREKENEERMMKLLQQEMERQKNYAEEKDEGEDEEEAEECLKHNILQCLEDEVQNLEQEMLALENEEQLIMKEEAEDMEEAANLENDDNEEETELVEHMNQLQEIHVEIEERKKIANKKKKVLERFQHVFDKDETDCKSGNKVGSIQDRLASFLDNKESKTAKSFEDNVFVGVSDVMSKFKTKLETQESDTPVLYSKNEIRRKPNATAMKFEMLNNEDDTEILSPKSNIQTDWSWKKKTAEELQIESSISDQKSAPKEKRNSQSFQDTKFNELLADINAVKQRMNERDLRRQAKENEQRIRDMEDAIKEVQDTLNINEMHLDSEPDSTKSESYSSKIDACKKVKTKEQKCEVVTKKDISSNKIGELRSQLMTMINENEKFERNDQSETLDVSVSQIKEKIMHKDPHSDFDHSKESKQIKPSSSTVSKIAQLLVQDEKEEEIQLRKAPKLILKNDEYDADVTPTKTLEELKAENKAQKWKWKEKDVRELQDFISAYDDIAPDQIIDQQQKLRDLEDEQEVVESLTNNKDTDILIQIREEKEKEFNRFMDGVKSYLEEDPKTAEEKEFKKGMEGYLSLIDDDIVETPKTIQEPKKKANLNTISKLKSSLFEEKDAIIEKRKSPKINKLDKEKIKSNFEESITCNNNKTETTMKTDKTQGVKNMFESMKKKR